MMKESDHALAEELVAYLDGELDSAAQRRIEARLATDPDCRRQLEQYQRSWSLLDELPRKQARASFAETTVEMVAVQARQPTRRSRVLATWWLAGLVLVPLAAWAGYATVTAQSQARRQQLSADLPIIEDLDAYRNAESLAFLRALAAEGLFPEDQSYEE